MSIGNPSGFKSDIEQFLIQGYNNTETDYPKTATISQLFEEQARMHPDHIAVVHGNRQISYKELNEQSNQVANLLRGKGINSSDIVGLMIDRTFEMIIGLMGILKSGAAYLPIDPESPQKELIIC